MHTKSVLVAALCFVFALSAMAQDVSGGRWIDLTHPFNAETVYWPTAKTFEKETVFAGHTDGGYYYTAYNFAAAEHGGTHLDAPIHFAEGALTADQLPVGQLIAPGIVIDVTRQAAEDVDYLVKPSDIEVHERAHGRIPEGAIVLINTGRARLYPNRERYIGTAERGQEAVAKLHFPGLSKEGAELLITRKIGAVGIDTPFHRLRTVEDLRHACHADDQEYPGLRERRRHVGPAAHRRHHHRVADEDRGRLRGAAPDHRTPAGWLSERAAQDYPLAFH